MVWMPWVLLVLRSWQCRGARFGGRSRLTATCAPQRLHVLDEGHHALFAHQPLEGRHQWLIAVDELGLRCQDGLADVRFIDCDAGAIGKTHARAEVVDERGC